MRRPDCSGSAPSAGGPRARLISCALSPPPSVFPESSRYSRVRRTWLTSRTWLNTTKPGRPPHPLSFLRFSLSFPKTKCSSSSSEHTSLGYTTSFWRWQKRARGTTSAALYSSSLWDLPVALASCSSNGLRSSHGTRLSFNSSNVETVGVRT